MRETATRTEARETPTPAVWPARVRHLHLALLAGLAILAGCAASEDTMRHYQLAPVAATAPAGLVPEYELVVDTVRLPDELDRTAMVVRMSATQSKVLDDHRWLSPLSDQLTRALASNLQSALPQAWVRPRDLPSRSARRYTLRIDVEQMVLARDASVTLVANWALLDGKDKVLRRDRALVKLTGDAGASAGGATPPPPSSATTQGIDPDGLARTASTAVARLAEQIAQSTTASQSAAASAP